MGSSLRFWEIRSLPDLTLPKYSEYFGSTPLEDFRHAVSDWHDNLRSQNSVMSFTLRYLFDPSAPDGRSALRIFVVIEHSSNVSVSGASIAQFGEGFGLEEASARIATPRTEILDNIVVCRRKMSVANWNREAFVVPNPIFGEGSSSGSSGLDKVFTAISVPTLIDVQVRHGQLARNFSALHALIDKLSNREKKSSAFLPLKDLALAVKEEFETSQKSLVSICVASGDKSAASHAASMFCSLVFGPSSMSQEHVGLDHPEFSSRARSILDVSVERECFGSDLASPLSKEIESSYPLESSSQRSEAELLGQFGVIFSHEHVRKLLSMPVPQSGSLKNFPLETQIGSATPMVRYAIERDRIILGENLDLNKRLSIGTVDLCKHAFVTGVSGSGKSVTMTNILLQLFEQRIPFLVLEPAKREYRNLANFGGLHGQLRVYTPGRDDLSPFQINPFQLGANARLAEHVAGLVAAFDSGLDVGSTARGVIEAAVWKCYKICGWKEDDNGQCGRPLPSVRDLERTILEELHALGFDDEAEGRITGIVRNRFARLTRGSIGRIFDSLESRPRPADLFQSHSIVELAQLHPSEANLLSLFLLTSLREFLEGDGTTERTPKLVLVLEEAHNLVPAINETKQGGDDSDGAVEAARYVSNMLAELRALGLAIIVVDQTPAAVARQVVRNTNLKLAHRTVVREDRETIGDVMLMTEKQCELLGRLRPGQAYAYFDQIFRPELLQVPFVESSPDTVRQIDYSDDNLREYLRECSWFRQTLSERISDLETRVDSLLEGAQRILQIAEAVEEQTGSYEAAKTAVVPSTLPLLEAIESQLLVVRAISYFPDSIEHLAHQRDRLSAVKKVILEEFDLKS